MILSEMFREFIPLHVFALSAALYAHGVQRVSTTHTTLLWEDPPTTTQQESGYYVD